MARSSLPESLAKGNEFTLNSDDDGDLGNLGDRSSHLIQNHQRAPSRRFSFSSAHDKSSRSPEQQLSRFAYMARDEFTPMRASSASHERNKSGHLRQFENLSTREHQSRSVQRSGGSNDMRLAPLRSSHDAELSRLRERERLAEEGKHFDCGFCEFDDTQAANYEREYDIYANRHARNFRRSEQIFLPLPKDDDLDDSDFGSCLVAEEAADYDTAKLWPRDSFSRQKIKSHAFGERDAPNDPAPVRNEGTAENDDDENPQIKSERGDKKEIKIQPPLRKNVDIEADIKNIVALKSRLKEVTEQKHSESDGDVATLKEETADLMGRISVAEIAINTRQRKDMKKPKPLFEIPYYDLPALREPKLKVPRPYLRPGSKRSGPVRPKREMHWKSEQLPDDWDTEARPVKKAKLDKKGKEKPKPKFTEDEKILIQAGFEVVPESLEEKPVKEGTQSIWQQLSRDGRLFDPKRNGLINMGIAKAEYKRDGSDSD